MQVGGLGLIPYRTIQFYNEQYALWQVEEIERDRVRNSEFGLRSWEIPHFAFITPH